MRPGGRFFIAGGVLLPLAALFRFVFVGYGTTALCLLAMAACLFFFGLMRRWGTKAARICSGLAAAVLIAGFGCLLAAEIPVLADARSDADTDADYLIVMGAAVNGTEPSLSLTERLEAALSWMEAHPDGIAVVSGGQGPGEDVTEARAMLDWLTARGVSPERIRMEDRATSSYENISYSLAVIEADGGDPTGRVALLSSEYHLHRLRYMAEKLGCDPVCVAARTGYISLAANYAVREAFAMWKCWLFGIA